MKNALTHYTFDSPRSKLRIARILKTLEGDPLTVEQLSQRLHASKSGTNAYVAYLHTSTPKRVYIADYDTSGYRPVAMFLVGDAQDTPKPPRKSKAQAWAEIKSDPVKLAHVHQKQAETRMRKRGGKPPAWNARTFDPPLEDQLADLIEVWPGLATRQIAEKLDIGFNTARNGLTRLKEKGVATYARRNKNGGAVWELTTRKHVQHAPISIKPQGIFSALGL